MERHLYELIDPIAAAVHRRDATREHGAALALLELLRAEYAADREPSTLLVRMIETFGLSELDCEVLVIAAAPELDVRVGALYSLLLGTDHVWPTAGLALELCGQGSLSAAGRARLRPAAPLRRHCLLSVDGPGPAMLNSLRVPERVVAHLLGDPDLDVDLAPLLLDVPSRCDTTAHQLARAIDAGVGVGHVRARPGTAGLASACGALGLAGWDALVFDLSRRRSSDEPAALARIAAREAGLRRGGLVLTGVDDCLARDRTVLDVVAGAPTPVMVVDDLGWERDWLSSPAVTVHASELSLPERAELWGAALNGDDSAEREGTVWQNLIGLRMAPQDIVAAARAASVAARAERTSVTIDGLRAAALAHGTARLENAAVRTEPRATLADLILPERTQQAVAGLVSWARNREAVLGSGRLAGRGTKGHGLTAMFAGPPGTGKSLAAEAVAGELGLELYTVDLSQIIDKYVGETEKRLERVISEAENLNVVLFFDEADSLFGSRGAVSNARDRYANQEVSYLLQRIERFEGLAILATNLRGNLDSAFTRRLHHVITFADPDTATRHLLWESHLGEVANLDGSDPIDVDWLARTVELSGGDIRNIVMAAAFAAAGDSGAAASPAVGMRHVVAAVEREYLKLGRRVPAGLNER